MDTERAADVKPFELDRESQHRLAYAAGLDPRDEAAVSLVGQVRLILGNHGRLEQAQYRDAQSRHRLAALRPLTDAVEALQVSLVALDPAMLDRLAAISNRRGALDPREQLSALAAMTDAIIVLRRELEDAETHSVPPWEARRRTVVALAQAFRRFGFGEDENLVTFLRIACRAARVALPSTSEEVLEILDTPPERRASGS